jgi:ABC-type glutathione transport system ATPase component
MPKLEDRYRPQRRIYLTEEQFPQAETRRGRHDAWREIKDVSCQIAKVNIMGAVGDSGCSAVAMKVRL